MGFCFLVENTGGLEHICVCGSAKVLSRDTKAFPEGIVRYGEYLRRWIQMDGT